MAWTNPSVRPHGVERILRRSGEVRLVDDWGRPLDPDDDGGESRHLKSTDTITDATKAREADAEAGMRVADLRRLFVAMDINRDGEVSAPPGPPPTHSTAWPAPSGRLGS